MKLHGKVDVQASHVLQKNRSMSLLDSAIKSDRLPSFQCLPKCRRRDRPASLVLRGLCAEARWRRRPYVGESPCEDNGSKFPEALLLIQGDQGACGSFSLHVLTRNPRSGMAAIWLEIGYGSGLQLENGSNCLQHLARIHQPVRIDRVLYFLHQLHLHRGFPQLDRVALLLADAVLG